MRRAVSQMMGGNIISKILGMGREIFVAALFGTGVTVAAFRIAQTCTLVPVNFFTSDSLNSAFIPLYKKFLGESREKADTLFWSVTALFAIFSIIIVTGLWWGASAWVSILAPGLGDGVALTAVLMLRIMGLGVPFYLMTALLNYLSMAHGDFVPMAARASVQSIGLVGGAVIAYFLNSPIFFAWGFSLSYLVFGTWALRRAVGAGSLRAPVFDRNLSVAAMRDFWQALKPLILLPLLMQGNIMVERAVASMIGIVTISALDYARFITETLLYLISVPLAFVGLTSWSGIDQDKLHLQLEKLVSSMLLISIPISSFLAVNAHLLVRIIYARGAFDASSVQATSQILMSTALGLWAQVIGYVLLKALSSQLRNRSVFLVMLPALLVNIICNLTLYKLLGPAALGIGNSAYGVVLLLATLLFLGLGRHFLRSVWLMAIGLIGYVFIHTFMPIPDNLFLRVMTSAGFAFSWWAAWVYLVPSLRQSVVAIVGKGIVRA